jgi:hypothetical protein
LPAVFRSSAFAYREGRVSLQLKARAWAPEAERLEWLLKPREAWRWQARDSAP